MKKTELQSLRDKVDIYKGRLARLEAEYVLEHPDGTKEEDKDSHYHIYTGKCLGIMEALQLVNEIIDR